MQMTVDDVVDVIAVRHAFVAAALAVLVIGSMGAARVALGAAGRVRIGNVEPVLVDVIAVHVVQMPVVQVVAMTAVAHAPMTAAHPMRVRVIRVRRATTHVSFLSTFGFLFFGPEPAQRKTHPVPTSSASTPAFEAARPPPG